MQNKKKVGRKLIFTQLVMTYLVIICEILAYFKYHPFKKYPLGKFIFQQLVMNFADLLWNNYIFAWFTKFTYFGSNVFFNFVDPPQNHCLFHQSRANVVHILEITCKEITYIEYQSRKKIMCKISMNTLIRDEMIMHFSDWPKECIFYQFFMQLFSFYYL